MCVFAIDFAARPTFFSGGRMCSLIPLEWFVSMRKRIISFSLFGDAPMYLQGAVRNARLAAKLYPTWTVRIFVSQEIPTSLIRQLRHEGAEIVHKQRVGLVDGTFWRFLPLADSSLDAVIIRDVDSRLSAREKTAVDEWLESGLRLHIMRDHPLHKVPILAGMWGGRGGCVPDIAKQIQDWKLWGKKGSDQDFLRDIIYPRFVTDSLIHSEFFQYEGESVFPFPAKREGGDHIGATVHADEDSLTKAQHDEHHPLIDAAEMRFLPRVTAKPKVFRIAEQWLRNLRKKVA
jgi:hypothetical protein